MSTGVTGVSGNPMGPTISRVAAHEIVIRFGRPFDVKAGGKFINDVREITIPFGDQQSAEDARAAVEVFVREVHDAGGEDYRPVIAGEVIVQGEITP
jgi:hypothetical protein